MAGFPSSGARHPQGSYGAAVDVESAASPPAPATSCHVALDIPEPVHKSDDRAVAVEEADLCCVITMFKGLYVWVILFSSYLFIRVMVNTKMTWDETLVAVMIAGVAVFAFLTIALAYSSEKQEWEEQVRRSKK